MSRPTVDQLTEDLYTDTSFTQPFDESLGWPWLVFLAGFAAAFGDLPHLVRDTDQGPGWSGLVDPDRCDSDKLWWLAQALGVALPAGADEPTQRDTIRDLPPAQRATVTAIETAAEQTLTPGSTATLILQAGGTYDDTLQTYESQTPDPDATFTAADNQMPAWRRLTLTTIPGWTWAQMLEHFGGAPTWSTVDSDPETDTWVELAHHLP